MKENIEEVQRFVYLRPRTTSKGVLHRKLGGGWRWLRGRAEHDVYMEEQGNAIVAQSEVP